MIVRVCLVCSDPPRFLLYRNMIDHALGAGLRLRPAIFFVDVYIAKIRRMSVLAKVISCAVIGLDGVPVEVEVDISQGLPSFQIVGLPDAAVQESKERVRPAVRNSGFTFPMKRLTVNLA